MDQSKAILVIEDEQDMADAIRDGLIESTEYSFTVDVANSPEDYVTGECYQRHYDLVVVDLHLAKGPFPFWGLRIVLDRAQEHPGTPVIVYSGYPQTENVVKAIQFGARDFISKVDCPSHQLVTLIERFFDKQMTDYERKKEIEVLWSANAQKWQVKYAGQSVVLVGTEVIAHGGNRLEALLKYGEKLETHPDWPEYPDVIDVPVGGQA